jgi:hypothetical protein
MAAPLAALLAFLTSGLLNTLIDEPRFLWLLLVLGWLCGRQAFVPAPAALRAGAMPARAATTAP